MTARLIRNLILTICMLIMAQMVSSKMCRNSNHCNEVISELVSDSVTSDYVFPTINSTESEFGLPSGLSISNILRTGTSIRKTSSIGFAGYTLLKSGKLINRHNSILYFINLNKFPYGLTKSPNHIVSLGKLII